MLRLLSDEDSRIALHRVLEVLVAKTVQLCEDGRYAVGKRELGRTAEPRRKGQEATAGRSGHGETGGRKQTQRETRAGGKDEEMGPGGNRLGGRAHAGYGLRGVTENNAFSGRPLRQKRD